MRAERRARAGQPVVEDLAEHEEVLVALLVGVVQDPRAEGLPELVVDVLHRVDAEAVDAEVLDPGLVDVRHPAHDAGVLGEQVVETEEVAVERVLAGEGRVAPVVVEPDVVEPERLLQLLLAGLELRGEGEGRVRVELGEGVRAGVVAVVEGVAVGVAVGLGVLRDVRRTGVLLEADHVGGVVGDDVEEHLDAALVRGLDETGQLGVRAEVGVDLGEVGDPVAVVAGRAVLGLHCLVLEDRREPDRLGAEALEVVELLPQAGDVATVVVALGGRVEPGGLAVAGEAAHVVAGVAVVEAVTHHEVEVLVGEVRAQRVPRDVPCVGACGRRRGARLAVAWGAGETRSSEVAAAVEAATRRTVRRPGTGTRPPE